MNTIEENLTKTKYKELVIYPTASVLVPTYNGERYLRKALDSVLQQTYTDFEIILIDDGSTDSTPQICDEYGQKYDFIRVVHQENIGLSKTRERLLEHATGKYIFWLDSDDYYDHTLLEKAVKAFEASGADIVAWGEVILKQTGDRVEYNPIYEVGEIKWKELAIWGHYAGVMLYASKKELWKNIEKIPDDVDLVEDVWMTSQIVQMTDNIFVLDESLYFYNQANLDSIMHTNTGRNLCNIALCYYRILKRNLLKRKSYANGFKTELEYILDIRRLLVNSYCVDRVKPSLTNLQVELIKSALEDLNRLYPQKKMKKFYLIQLCVIYGIDVVCRWFGQSKIRKFECEKISQGDFARG